MAEKIDIEVRRYPLLRVICLLYKIAAALAFLLATGAAVLSVAGAVVLPGSNVVLAGGLGALGLYTVSLLIDLFLETNNSARQIAEAVAEQNKLLLEQRKMLAQIYRRAGNPYPRTIAERQLSSIEKLSGD